VFLLQFGKSALMKGSEVGHTAAVRALLEAGADRSIRAKVFSTRTCMFCTSTALGLLCMMGTVPQNHRSGDS
jgi:hypothetical protein